jgi:hypothetical protein
LIDKVAKRLPGALLRTQGRWRLTAELVLDLIGGAAVGWGLKRWLPQGYMKWDVSDLT